MVLKYGISIELSCDTIVFEYIIIDWMHKCMEEFANRMIHLLLTTKIYLDVLKSQCDCQNNNNFISDYAIMQIFAYQFW